MEYFSNTFSTTAGLNTGVIICFILMALLIFLELTPAIATSSKRIAILGSYRASFRNMSTILFIIFMGIVFAKVVMIVAT